MSHRKTEGGCIILSTVECLHSNSILIYSSYLNVQFLPFSFLNLPFLNLPFLLHIGPFPKRWVLLFAVYAFLRSHFCLLDLKCAPFRPRCAVFLPICPSFLFPLVPLYPFRVIYIFSTMVKVKQLQTSHFWAFEISKSSSSADRISIKPFQRIREVIISNCSPTMVKVKAFQISSLGALKKLQFQTFFHHNEGKKHPISEFLHPWWK